MKTLVAILTLLAVVLAIPALAAKKGKQPQETTPDLKIVEVNAVGIVVTFGKSGDEHIAYKITDNTKITLNGATVAARDLRPGMMAKIVAGKDKVATSIRASDAPTHPHGGRVG